MFFQPESIDEALEAKHQLGGDGMLLAGGTDMVVLMNRGRLAPKHVIDLSRVRTLRTILPESGRLALGGCVTFRDCCGLPLDCLADASRSVGGPGIREMGTLAGNLASASPAADGATALLALDAEVVLRSRNSVRSLPISDFFLDYRRTALGPQEIITTLNIPAGYRTVWAKVGKRGAVNISIVAAAVALTPEKKLRIALASVAPTPIRCRQAEAALDGRTLTAEAIREASELVRNEVQPITDHRAGADYKRHLSAILVRRSLERLVTDENTVE